jgi:hypothetical protein
MTGIQGDGSAPAMRGGTNDAARQIQKPAWGLIITGVISWVTIPLAFSVPFTDNMRDLNATQRAIFQISFGVIPLVIGTITALAGFRMKRLEGYPLAIFAAVLPIFVLILKLIGLSFGTLAIGPADLVGAPVGLWVLVVLTRSDVKAAFNPQSVEREAASSSLEGAGLATERRPFGFAFAVMGLFGLAWIAAGALRNFGVPGLAAAIGLVLLVTFGVLRWKLAYRPALWAELSHHSPIRRYGALAVSAVLFILAMLAVEQVHMMGLDSLYSRNADLMPLPFDNSTTLPDLRDLNINIPDALVSILNTETRLHRINPRIVGGRAALLAVGAGLLIFAALAAAIGTRRFQYQWSLHLQPACYVASLLVLMLPVAMIGYMVCVAATQKGWGATPPKTFRVNTTTDEFRNSLQRWALRTGYELQFNAMGGYSDFNYASYRLTPSSSLDRWQYGPGHIHRPLLPVSVTCLVQGGSSESEPAVVVELPFVMIDSREEKLWPQLIDSLRAALETSDEAETLKGSNTAVSQGDAIGKYDAIGLTAVAVAVGLGAMWRFARAESGSDSPRNTPNAAPRPCGTLGEAWDKWRAGRDRWLTPTVQMILVLLFVLWLFMYCGGDGSSRLVSQSDGQQRRQTFAEIGRPIPWFRCESWPDDKTSFRWKFNVPLSLGYFALGYLLSAVNWQIEKARAKATGERLGWVGSPTSFSWFWVVLTLIMVAWGLHPIYLR